MNKYIEKATRALRSLQGDLYLIRVCHLALASVRHEA